VVPAWRDRRDNDDSRFVTGVVDAAGHVALVVLLYIAIGARVRMFCLVTAGEELSGSEK
jgi:hypothetical protein